jgi:hypothetical protein
VAYTELQRQGWTINKDLLRHAAPLKDQVPQWHDPEMPSEMIPIYRRLAGSAA